MADSHPTKQPDINHTDQLLNQLALFVASGDTSNFSTSILTISRCPAAVAICIGCSPI